MQLDFFLKGKMVSIIPTTMHHLAEYTSWHKWEGDLTILNEEDLFANQADRIRRIKLLKEDAIENVYYLSVLTREEELISLLEFYLINSDAYCPNWILKKIKNGTDYALEAGQLIINYFFFYRKEIECIIIDIPEERSESIKMLEKFGFKHITYYYRLNYKNQWEKIQHLLLRKNEIWN